MYGVDVGASNLVNLMNYDEFFVMGLEIKNG